MKAPSGGSPCRADLSDARLSRDHRLHTVTSSDPCPRSVNSPLRWEMLPHPLSSHDDGGTQDRIKQHPLWEHRGLWDVRHRFQVGRLQGHPLIESHHVGG